MKNVQRCVKCFSNAKVFFLSRDNVLSTHQITVSLVPATRDFLEKAPIVCNRIMRNLFGLDSFGL